MFGNKLLTADPKEHIIRAKTLLAKNDNSLLAYCALELRFAIERIIHNQYSLSSSQSIKSKKKNDPKRKKLLMNKIDPESDSDYDVYSINNKEKIYWGKYKNIPESKVKTIEGKLGNLLHMNLDINLGLEDDPWYFETRNYLQETANYLEERITDSIYYFALKDVDNFEFVKR